MSFNFESTAMDESQRGGASLPSSLEKAMFWSLLPAILVVPSWMFAGRGLLGGGVGWNAIILGGTLCPILFIYHCAIFISALRQNMRNEESCGDYHVRKELARLLLRYFIAHFLIQVFLEDGGDQGSTGSAAQSLLGLNEAFCAILALTFFLISVALMVLTTVSICQHGAPLQHEQDHVHYASVLVDSA
mmetsp:Transcript_19716/g.46860  ORF Transcript_19716/g.46860 Transcript_19716/m.46860 type:complete len:189 (-) Transcript_19716:194-760(-)